MPDFLLRFHSMLRYCWCFLAEHVLSQPAIHSLSLSQEKVCGVPVPFHLLGFSSCAMLFSPRYQPCQLFALRWSPCMQRAYFYAVYITESSVTKPNVDWYEAAGWAYPLGIVTFVLKHCISHFPVCLFQRQLGYINFFPTVSASSLCFIPCCSNNLWKQQVTHTNTIPPTAS